MSRKQVVRCTQVTQCTVGLSDDGTIKEYTYEKSCDALSALVAGSDAREYVVRYPGRRHQYADVFRRLEQRRRETGTVTRTARVDAGHRRTVRTLANKYAIIAALVAQHYLDCTDTG